nr:hypothetical protein [Saccharophagus degradans]
MFFFLCAVNTVAAPFESHVHSRAELEYGVVLFDYFQQDYFYALVEHEYTSEIGNTIALDTEGEMLSGGMMVSYGMPDEAERNLAALVNSATKDTVRNRIWYYLAKLHYNKSQLDQAYAALDRISGDVDPELHFDYHYLATLIRNDGSHTQEQKEALKPLSKNNPAYPYLLFNFAIGHLNSGDLGSAVVNLEEVSRYSGTNEEMSVLGDRAKHGLAQLALQAGNLPQAWLYLQNIRTTGLYSNRALLSYAWSAIKLKRFNDAIPALEILNSRSIAIPEVQEAKVLLAHLYEQEGSPRKALKGNLLAEKQFREGLNMLQQARGAISDLDVPREFVANLEAVMDSEDWYGSKPSVDYKKLTPFLVDLMSSNPFNETLRELADLYALEANLENWKIQAEEHLIILKATKQKSMAERIKEALERKKVLSAQFTQDSADLRLHALTLSEEEQARMDALLQTTQRELEALDKLAQQMAQVESVYQHPADYESQVQQKHKEIEEKLEKTRAYIARLEPVMRDIVNKELNKHEDRMGYYLAQSRLAKARLYDSTLLELERAQGDGASGTKAKSNGEQVK